MDKHEENQSQVHEKSSLSSRWGIGFVCGLFLGLIGFIIGYFVYDAKDANGYAKHTFMKGWIVGFVISCVASILMGVWYYYTVGSTLGGTI